MGHTKEGWHDLILGLNINKKTSDPIHGRLGNGSTKLL